VETLDGVKSSITIDERVRAVQDRYLDSIAKYVSKIELLENKYPIQILVEVRDIFYHLTKISFCENEEQKEYDMQEAERHTEEAILDCYKTLCFSYKEYYEKYRKDYAHYDLSAVHDGKYVIELSFFID